MRILIVTRRYAPFAGGAERQLARVAEALVRCGNGVTVVTGRHDAGLARWSEERGVMIRRLPDPKTRAVGTLAFLARLLGRMWVTRRFYDVVLVSQVNETSATAALAARLLGKRVALRLSSIGPHGNFAWTRGRMLGRPYRWAARGVHAVVGQSDAFREECAREGIPPARVRIIPNAAPPESLPPLTKGDERGISTSPFRLLWCGRLHAVKNPGLLVDVAARLRAACVPFAADVVGDGELRESLQERIRAEGLADLVSFHGVREDVQAFFERADALVLTSISEAMPNAVLEAMAAGVPVVATDVGGVPALIRDGATGLLAPSGDADAMAAAVGRLVDDPSLRARLASAARESVRAHHDPDRIAARYEDLFTAPGRL